MYPALDASGFDVTVRVEGRSVLVETDTGWHDHRDDASPEQLGSVTGLVRDLLSPAMRIRELRASDRPYRWHLEHFDGQGWRRESTMGLMLWNVFGSRSERIYANRHLPSREDFVVR